MSEASECSDLGCKGYGAKLGNPAQALQGIDDGAQPCWDLFDSCIDGSLEALACSTSYR